MDRLPAKSLLNAASADFNPQKIDDRKFCVTIVEISKSEIWWYCTPQAKKGFSRDCSHSGHLLLGLE